MQLLEQAVALQSVVLDIVLNDSLASLIVSK